MPQSEYQRLYYLSHKEKRKAYFAVWYKKNKDREHNKSRLNYRDNKESILLRQAKIRTSRREFVYALKNKPCADCGVNYPPYVMDLDHRDRATKINSVGRMVSKFVPLEIIEREVDKCDVVCANCHRLRTYKRKDYLPLENIYGL